MGLQCLETYDLSADHFHKNGQAKQYLHYINLLYLYLVANTLIWIKLIEARYISTTSGVYSVNGIVYQNGGRKYTLFL